MSSALYRSRFRSDGGAQHHEGVGAYHSFLQWKIRASISQSSHEKSARKKLARIFSGSTYINVANSNAASHFVGGFGGVKGEGVLGRYEEVALVGVGKRGHWESFAIVLGGPGALFFDARVCGPSRLLCVFWWVDRKKRSDD